MRPTSLCVIIVFAFQVVSSGVVLGQIPKLQGTGYQPPQQLDGGGNSSTTPSAQDSASKTPLQSSDIAKKSPQTQFDTLYRELDNLIPGKLSDQPETKKVIEEAVTAFQLRNAGRVVEILKAQKAKDPDFPPTDLLLAGLSFAIEDTKAGRLLLERSANQNPDNPATYSAFARLAINEGRLTDALALLEKQERLIAKSEMSAKGKSYYETLYLDAMTDVAVRQQRLDDARVLLDKQRQSTPNNAKVLMVSAELEFKQKNVEKAIEYLTKLKQVQPATRTPESIVAGWFDRTGDTKQADEWAAAAATKYPKNANVQLEHANWAIRRGKLPVATEAIKQAETIGGETLLSKNLKARIAFSRESYALAEAHYQSLVAQQPDNFDVNNMYALCLIESDNETKRARSKELAIKNFRALPNNLVAQATMGYIHLKLGELEQAKSVLAQAAQKRGSSPEIDYFLGCLLAEMKRNDDAKKTLEGALKYQGFFLYRSMAEKLLAKLENELPAPEKK